MAIIYDDHIKCDKSDPWLKVRSPALLIAWVTEAAKFRGISLEELVNETLYDSFGRLESKTGVFCVLKPREKAARRTLTRKRCTARRNLRIAKDRAFKPVQLTNEVDWTLYEQLRKANLRKLEEYSYDYRQARRRSTAELELLQAELERRGINRTHLRIGHNCMFLRPTRESVGENGERIRNYLIKEPQSMTSKAAKPLTPGYEAGIKHRMETNEKLIEVVIDACKACGAEKTLARIEEFRAKDEDRLKAKALMPKNPTI